MDNKHVCEFCHKHYITFNLFSCKCKFKFLCSKCRLPEAHCCSFDWKNFGRKILIEQNPILTSCKLEKI